MAFDVYGQELTADASTVSHYDQVVRAILLMQTGTLEMLDEVIAEDPGFAVAHATKAALDFEQRDLIDSAEHFHAAVEALERGATARERAFVHIVGERIHGDRGAYGSYVQEYPGDPMGFALAMPTIAFSGAYDNPLEAWHRLDELAPRHGDDWWFTALLAFARVEQGDLDGAAELADRSLSVEPLGGTAAHARAHAYYEQGEHVAGARWLDGWIEDAGHSAIGRAHFSWHVVMHDLGLDDIDAVLARYDRDLAPTVLTGTRSLVDGASLLWRLNLMNRSDRADDIEAVRSVAGRELELPSTAFSAMHAAIADAAAGDLDALGRLAARCHSSSTPAMADVAGPLAVALQHHVRGDYDIAADELLSVFARSQATGASRVQCEVIEDTAIVALISAGRKDEAVSVLDARLDRRAHAGDEALRNRLWQTQAR